MLRTTLPLLFKTIRQPELAVADVPSVVGRLPTITQPRDRTVSAVLRPTPPGQPPGRFADEMVAKSCWAPLGEICTMVVPVPCWFVLLLKLLTNTSPCISLPLDRGTTATP